MGSHKVHERVVPQVLGKKADMRNPYSKVDEEVHDDDTATQKHVEAKPAQMTCGVVLLAGVASVGGFLFGYDTGVVSGAMLEIKQPDSGVGNEGLNAQQQELVVSCTVAAAAAGSWLSGLMQRSSYFGRRTVLLLASVVFVVAALLMAFSVSVLQLLVGRVLVGLSVGAASHSVPIYIAEAAPPHMRGALNGLNLVMIVSGQVIASATCCFYAREDYAAGTISGWRWMLGWGAAPAVLLFVGAVFLPESPRWLLHVAQHRENAKAALVWLRRDEDVAASELVQIEASTEEEESAQDTNNTSLLQKLCARRTRRALQVGLGLQFLQQATGINTIMYYSATILEMAQTASSDSLGCHHRRLASSGFAAGDVSNVCWTAPIATSQLVGTAISMLVVDRVGRRPLLLFSLLSAGASLFALGFAFHGVGNSSLAIAAMCTYLVTFGIGLAPLPWLVNAEIYPMETRGAATGLTTATNWIANFIVAATFLDVSRALSTNRECPEAHPDGGFWLYASVALVGSLWIVLTMPETKGKSLEEIDALFS